MIHLPSFRMHEAIPPLPHMSSWCDATALPFYRCQWRKGRKQLRGVYRPFLSA